MTIHRLINWALAAIIAVGMGSSYLLDGPSDIDADQAQLMSLRDAQKAAKAEKRLAKAQKSAGVAL